MTTRSSKNWSSDTGNINAQNVNMIFESDNEYGIPVLFDDDFIPSALVPYGTEVRRSYKQAIDKTVHFFLDDYKFESMWNKPYLTSKPLLNVGRALTPDFSLYLDYPRAIQIFNVYRNRWLGRYWQEQGIEVIPTVAWGDPSTFDFCFCGIPRNSIVAIGTVGINSNEAKEAFKLGFEEMMKRIEPRKLLVYGETKPIQFEDYLSKDDIHYYESFWKARRRVLNGR